LRFHLQDFTIPFRENGCFLKAVHVSCLDLSRMEDSTIFRFLSSPPPASAPDRRPACQLLCDCASLALYLSKALRHPSVIRCRLSLLTASPYFFALVSESVTYFLYTGRLCHPQGAYASPFLVRSLPLFYFAFISFCKESTFDPTSIELETGTSLLRIAGTRERPYWYWPLPPEL